MFRRLNLIFLKCSLVMLLIMSALNTEAAGFRFTDTANRWTFEYTWGQFGETYTQEIYTYGIGADSFFQGNVYKTLKLIVKELHREYYFTYSHSISFGGGNPNNSYIGYLFREDTATNIVYGISGGAEYVIYDGSWQVGDTVYAQPNGSPLQYYSIVTHIDSTLISGEWQKVFGMLSNFGPYYIIEGIGSTKGTAFSMNPYLFENDAKLRCFSRAGYVPPIVPKLSMDPFDNSSSCVIKRLDVIEQSSFVSEITIFPNPFVDGFTISYPNNSSHSSIKVSILNMLGQIVHTETLTSNSATNQVSLGNTIPGGLYSVVIEHANSGVVYRGLIHKK